MVVHPFNPKISKEVSFFRTLLFARLRGFMQSAQNFRTNILLYAEYITRATHEYHLDKAQISRFAFSEIYHCNAKNEIGRAHV